MTPYPFFDSVQKIWMDKVFKLFVQGDISQFDITSTESFEPLNMDNGSEKQKETTQLFAALVCALRKDVVLPVANIEDYLNDLVTLALGSSNATQITSASRMIGSIVNKWRDSKESFAFFLFIYTYFLA